MKYEALNQKIAEMQDEIIAAIQQNMRIDSVKGEAKPDAPYGKVLRQLLWMRLPLAKDLVLRQAVRTTV